MTSTIPDTLAEYQAYVRQQAFDIQKEMGWPDDKLNEALRALGLPEKVTLLVPVKITGEMFVVFDMSDGEYDDIEAAKAAVANFSPDELRNRLARVSRMDYTVKSGEPTDMPPLAVGEYDTTLSNRTFAGVTPGASYCEEYNPTGTRYCTRQRGHDGDHARGNGQTIVAVWPN